VTQTKWPPANPARFRPFRKIAFIGKSYGDAYELNLATGAIRNLTAHAPHEGAATRLKGSCRSATKPLRAAQVTGELSTLLDGHAATLKTGASAGYIWGEPIS